MAEEAALRAQLDGQRDQIGHTVDQIENRVRPGRVARRKRGELAGKVTGWKNRVLGSDDEGSDSSMGDRASDLASSVGDGPEAVRRRTRGNPAGPGLIAFGAGLLVAAVLPETRREQEMVRKVQPELDQIASEAAHSGSDIGHDVQESARDAVSSVKESASSAASEVAQESKDAVKHAT